jgi:hypothetical protein
MDMMHLQLHFLVLRVIIQYHIMIPLSSLFSLIDVPRQLFCMHGMHDTAYDTSIVASLTCPAHRSSIPLQWLRDPSSPNDMWDSRTTSS